MSFMRASRFGDQPEEGKQSCWEGEEVGRKDLCWDAMKARLSAQVNKDLRERERQEAIPSYIRRSTFTGKYRYVLGSQVSSQQ